MNSLDAAKSEISQFDLQSASAGPVGSRTGPVGSRSYFDRKCPGQFRLRVMYPVQSDQRCRSSYFIEAVRVTS